MLNLSNQPRWKLTLFIGLPVLLFCWLAYIASWRPRTLDMGPLADAYVSDANGEFVPANPPQVPRNLFEGYTAIAFSPNGKMLAAAKHVFVYPKKPKGPLGDRARATSQLQIWDFSKNVSITLPFFAAQWHDVHHDVQYVGPFQSVIFSPDNSRVMVEGDGHAMAIASLRTRKWAFVHTPPFPSNCRIIGFSSDSKTAYFAEWQTMHHPDSYGVYRMDNWLGITFSLSLIAVETISNRVVKRTALRFPAEWPSHFSMMRDGTTAVCATHWGSEGNSLEWIQQSRLVFFDVRTGRILRTLQSEASVPHGMACSPDGEWVAIGKWGGTVNESDVQLQHVQSGEITRPRVLLQMVRGVDFSPNSKYLLVISDKFALTMLNVPNLSIHRVLAKSSNATDAAFSPDGKTIATANSDDTVKLWRTE